MAIFILAVAVLALTAFMEFRIWRAAARMVLARRRPNRSAMDDQGQRQ